MPYNIEPLEKYRRKRMGKGDFEPIPPLENYTPQDYSPPPDDMPGQGAMMDISRRDSHNFGNWMREAGGFHFDPANQAFASDAPPEKKKNFMDELSGFFERGGNVAEQVMGRFKDKMAKAPKDALMQMAERSAENPAGYVTDALLGGMGAPGALATMAGAAGDAAQGLRLGTVGGSLAKGFQAAKDAGKTWMGLEGSPKFEFSDEAATLRELPKAFQTSKLGEVLDHPELYSQYPDIAEMGVQKMIPTLNNAEKGGEFLMLEGKPGVRVRGNRSPEEIRESLLHEIQHAIQQKEKFPLDELEAYTRTNPKSKHYRDFAREYDRLKS
jgi:hypothetical protein